MNEMKFKAAPRQNDFSATPLNELPLTMVYAPQQSLGKLYEAENALKNGTLFPAIDKPLVSWGDAK